MAKLDLPLKAFTPQENEIEQLAWVQLDELNADVRDNPNKYLHGFAGTIPNIEDLK